MFNQHAKFLKDFVALPWRRDRLVELPAGLARLARITTGHAPGSRFIITSANKEGRVVRGLPTAGCELPAVVMAPLPAQPSYVNVVIAGKHPSPQWMTTDAAVEPLHRGHRHLAGASNDQGVAPDVVMACCGDVPTLEMLGRRFRSCASTCPS